MSPFRFAFSFICSYIRVSMHAMLLVHCGMSIAHGEYNELHAYGKVVKPRNLTGSESHGNRPNIYQKMYNKIQREELTISIE